MSEYKKQQTYYIERVLKILLGTFEPDNLSLYSFSSFRRIAKLYKSYNGITGFTKYKGEIDKHLHCYNCWGVFKEMISLHCGHLLCKNCLINEVQDFCPMCEKKFIVAKIEMKSSISINSFYSSFNKRLAEFEEKKCIANKKLREKDYFNAILDYTDLLKTGICRHIILSNRSYAYLIIGKTDLALNDAIELIKEAWFWKKAHYRLAMVFKRKENYFQLTEALLNALIMSPNDNLILSELSLALKALLTSEIVDLLKNDSYNISYLPEKSKQDEHILQIIYKFHLSLFEELSNGGEFSGNMKIRCRSKSESFLLKNSKLLKLNFEDEMGYHIITNNLNSLRKDCNVQDFKCSLCLRIYINPVTVACGHTFCKHCIMRSLDHIPSCPLCKQDLYSFTNNKNIVISYSLKKLMEYIWPLQVFQHEKCYSDELSSITSCPNQCAYMVCIVAIPKIPIHLHIFEPRYRLMLRRAMESGTNQFGMVFPNQSALNHHSTIGSILKIEEMISLDNGRSLVNAVASETRYKILHSKYFDGYLICDIEEYSDNLLNPNQLKSFNDLSISVYSLAKKLIDKQKTEIKMRINNYYGEFPIYEPYNLSTNSTILNRRKRKLEFSNVETVINPSLWIWWLCAVLPIDENMKYNFLSTKDPVFRIEKLKKVIDSILILDTSL